MNRICIRHACCAQWGYDNAACCLPANSCRMRLPCGQGPQPSSAAICPIGPNDKSSLPHRSANNAARSAETKGSSVLATTTLGKENSCSGRGANDRTASSSGANRSTSPGATSIAPKTGARSASAGLLEACSAQCATRAQPKLCETRMKGLRHPSMTPSSAVSQARRSGRFQSDCATVCEFGISRRQIDCQ